MTGLIRFFTLLFAAAFIFSYGSSPKIISTKTDEGISFSENGRIVLFYQQKPKSMSGRFSRANYFHPLHALDGSVLTEDFPPDHLHHRGIFWAWHQVWIGEKRIGDQWMLENFSWDIVKADIVAGKRGSQNLKTHVLWKSPLWLDGDGQEQPFVEEEAVVTLFPSHDQMQILDFAIRLTALADSVKIGGSEDEKGYGGFSIRLKLPEDVRFQADYGEAEPQNAAVPASPWMDISGSFSGQNGFSGVAVLVHHASDGFPQPWILRKKDSMQNPVFPGREAVLIAKEKPIELHYRLILHNKDFNRQRLAAFYRQYEKSIKTL